MRQAIILASGIGSRLATLTQHVPKAMISLGAATLIQRQMQILFDNGIRDFLITTGFKQDALEAHVRELAGRLGVKVDFVCNDRFNSSNYIYSLWLARDQIHSDVVLLHGDLVFSANLISGLFGDARPNLVPVNKIIPLPEKDFKAAIRDGKVAGIGTNLSGGNTYFCAPVYKLTHLAVLQWLQKIAAYIASDNVNCYAEEALNEIAQTINLEPFYYENEFCTEIDTMADYQKARAHMGRTDTLP